MLRRATALLIPGAFLACAMPGCSSDESRAENEQKTILFDNVNVFSASEGASIEVEDKRLVFPRKGNEGLLKKKPGDVLVGDRGSPQGTGTNPFGFLRKVVSVKAEGDRIVIETVRAQISDAVAQGKGQLKTRVDIFGKNDAGIDIQALREGPGLKTQSAELFSMVDQTILSGSFSTSEYEIGANKNKVKASVSVEAKVNEASLQFTPQVDLGIDVGLTGVNEFHAIFTGQLYAKLLMELQATASVTVGFEHPDLKDAAAQLAADLASVSKNAKKIGDAEWGIPLPTFFVGPVPVTSDLRIRVELGCGAEVSGTASVQGGFDASSSVSLGARYLSGSGWQTVNTQAFSFNAIGPTVALSGGVSVSCSLVPSIGIMIYGGFGPYLYLDATGTASASVSCAGDNPQSVASFALQRTLAGGVGARLTVLEHDLIDSKLQLFSLNMGGGELNVPLGANNLCGHASGSTTCGALQAANGWAERACQQDDSADGECKGQGLKTDDCEHCCNPAALDSICFGVSDGLWCGESLEAKNPGKGATTGWLYHCVSGVNKAQNPCPGYQCYQKTDGQDDACLPGLCYGTLEPGVEGSLSGWFCGAVEAHPHGDANKVYFCENGQPTALLDCGASNCFQESAGKPDHCPAAANDFCAGKANGWHCDGASKRLCLEGSSGTLEACTGCSTAGTDSEGEAQVTCGSCVPGEIECVSPSQYMQCELKNGVPTTQVYPCKTSAVCYVNIVECAGCQGPNCSSCKAQDEICQNAIDCCSGLECRVDSADEFQRCLPPKATCGNGSCTDPGEDCSTCPQDCGSCCQDQCNLGDAPVCNHPGEYRKCEVNAKGCKVWKNYACKTSDACFSDINKCMNGCTCSGGKNMDGSDIDPASTYCGMKVCGVDVLEYQCGSNNQWSATGVKCCQDQCNLGDAAACNTPSQYRKCEVGSNGCNVWNNYSCKTSTACFNSLNVCMNGCATNCTLGETQCNHPGQYRKCESDPNTGCDIWKNYDCKIASTCYSDFKGCSTGTACKAKYVSCSATSQCCSGLTCKKDADNTLACLP